MWEPYPTEQPQALSSWSYTADTDDFTSQADPYDIFSFPSSPMALSPPFYHPVTGEIWQAFYFTVRWGNVIYANLRHGDPSDPDGHWIDRTQPIHGDPGIPTKEICSGGLHYLPLPANYQAMAALDPPDPNFTGTSDTVYPWTPPVHLITTNDGDGPTTVTNPFCPPNEFVFDPPDPHPNRWPTVLYNIHWEVLSMGVRWCKYVPPTPTDTVGRVIPKAIPPLLTLALLLGTSDGSQAVIAGAGRKRGKSEPSET